MTRTSLSHPLQIAEVPASGGGWVGITFCPGKKQPSAATGAWDRDLGIDLQAIKAWGAKAMVSLITSQEMADLSVLALGPQAEAAGLTWLHLPIEDVTAPTEAWGAEWASHRDRLHAILDAGGRVLVHCKGGLGRAGTVAALLLVERGMPADEAIAAVRGVRTGAIETAAQAAYVRRAIARVAA